MANYELCTMNFELPLLIILFWAYVLTTCKVGGIPYCLSETYYTLGRYGFLFTLFQLAMSALLAIQLHGLFGASSQSLPAGFPAVVGWILVASIAGIGLVPDFRRSWQHPIHYGLTICAMLCITVLCILRGLWYLPFLVTLSSLRLNWLLGLEIGFYTTGFLYLLLA